MLRIVFARTIILVFLLSLSGFETLQAGAAGELKWKYKTGGGIYSSPAIGTDGIIYVGSADSCLYALNPSGSLKWKFQTGGKVYYSPAIGADGTIYVGSEDDNFYALNPDGSLKWKYHTNGNIKTSPAIGAESTIYVGSADSCLYALNPSGSLKWKYQIGYNWEYDFEASPVIGADGTIYVGKKGSILNSDSWGTYDGYICAIGIDGATKWIYHTEAEIHYLIIGADGTVYANLGGGCIYALNNYGILKWKYCRAGYSSPTINTDGTVYVTGGSTLLAVNPDGFLKWEKLISIYSSSSPTIGADGTIYVVAEDRYQNNNISLLAVNPDSTLKWLYKTTGRHASDPAVGADGTVYVGVSDGYLYAFDSGTAAGLADSPWPKDRRDMRNTGSAYGTVYKQSLELSLTAYALSTYSSFLTFYNLHGTFNARFEIDNPGSTPVQVNLALYYKSSSGVTGIFEPKTYTVSVQPGSSWYERPCSFPSGTSTSVSSVAWYLLDAYNSHINSTDFVPFWDIQFSEPFVSEPVAPVPPPLLLIPGDEQVTIVWSDINPRTLDPYYYYLQHTKLDSNGYYRQYDFEGYRLFRSFAGPNDSSSELIFQCSNSEDNLRFSFIDKKEDDIPYYRMTNGDTVWYALVPYDSNYDPATGHEFSLPLPGAAKVWASTVPDSIPETTCLLPGDINSDGQVDLFDILTIVRFALGKKTPTALEKACTDMNADGKIDVVDVLACVNKALGRTLQLAAYSQTDIAQLDRTQLKSDLVSLGAEPELIADVFQLLSAQTPALPKAFSLGQNSPNPFNPSTTISYSVPEGPSVKVSLKIYDLRGRLVRNLVEEMRDPGSYSVFWDGRNGNGQQLSSGVYLYRMRAGEFVQTRKMVLLK